MKFLACSIRKTRRATLTAFALGMTIAVATVGLAQTPHKYATQTPPGIAASAEVNTRLGVLRFTNGFPDNATVQLLYDNLDFQRAVQAYLMAIAAVNQAGMREGLRRWGPDNQTDVIWENMVDARTIELTANSNIVYSFLWLDTHKGPLVIETPPGSDGGIDDFWYRWVTDTGLTGPDKGKGGKYVLLPPDYKGAVPSGYFVVRSRTYGNWFAFRSFLVNGMTTPAVALVKRTLRIYPLGRAAAAPPMRFVNASGVYSNFVAPADYRFWELLNQVVQEEPSDSLDANTLGLYASIGIVKGRPFAPGARMRQILTEAAAVGDGTARAIAFRTREQAAYYYPHSAWRRPFTGGYQFNVIPGVRDLDAYVTYSWLATGVTPAMEAGSVGQGAQAAWAAVDASGAPLDGAKFYRLHLPAPIPTKTYWSIMVYDNQLRSMLQTDQRLPAVSSMSDSLAVNSDHSIDIYFGPTPPTGKRNWVQTLPGQGWNVILRLWEPLEPWFDQTWRPGEIEPLP